MYSICYIDELTFGTIDKLWDIFINNFEITFHEHNFIFIYPNRQLLANMLECWLIKNYPNIEIKGINDICQLVIKINDQKFIIYRYSPTDYSLSMTDDPHMLVNPGIDSIQYLRHELNNLINN